MREGIWGEARSYALGPEEGDKVVTSTLIILLPHHVHVLVLSNGKLVDRDKGGVKHVLHIHLQPSPRRVLSLKNL